MGQVLSADPLERLTSAASLRHQINFPSVFKLFGRHLSTDKNEEKHFDLTDLPPELALAILSYLNPTDLYLASCVWWKLASNESLWRALCFTSWPFCSAYGTWRETPNFSFRILFLRLDEARLTFNSDAFEGVRYLQENQILANDISHLAAYLHVTPDLDPLQKSRFLESRPDVLDEMLRFKDFHETPLPDALRKLFTELPSPEIDTHNFIPRLIEGFSEQFVRCNPRIGLRADVVYVLCFSLLMLSQDFANPKIKNKMSKREFIRNTRQAVPSADSDLLGHLYDNVYVEGNIATLVTITADPEGYPPGTAGNGGGFSRRFVAIGSRSANPRPYHRVVANADG